ncbi:hypothetical protein C1H46_042236 [Malus baccata]|uniref:Uncharacterized protein n=1 Tax=Malus baccata TaxID=106549 RepID=A0A540KDB9_MALBA|nr:hypothetical protein C1H46_042236 [Malus baccata]
MGPRPKPFPPLIIGRLNIHHLFLTQPHGLYRILQIQTPESFRVPTHFKSPTSLDLNLDRDLDLYLNLDLDIDLDLDLDLKFFVSTTISSLQNPDLDASSRRGSVGLQIPFLCLAMPGKDDAPPRRKRTSSSSSKSDWTSTRPKTSLPTPPTSP